MPTLWVLVIPTGVVRAPASRIQPRHLAVAVEPVAACEDGIVADQPLARADDRNPGSDRPLPDHERPLAPHDG